MDKEENYYYLKAPDGEEWIHKIFKYII